MDSRNTLTLRRGQVLCFVKPETPDKSLQALNDSLHAPLLGRLGTAGLTEHCRVRFSGGILCLSETSALAASWGDPSREVFPGDDVRRFGKEWQEISPGIFQRLLQWENRTGNAPPDRLFPAACVRLSHRPCELREKEALSLPLALRGEWRRWGEASCRRSGAAAARGPPRGTARRLGRAGALPAAGDRDGRRPKGPRLNQTRKTTPIEKKN